MNGHELISISKQEMLKKEATTDKYISFRQYNYFAVFMLITQSLSIHSCFV